MDYTKFDMNMALSLLATAEYKYNKLTSKEKQARKEERERWEEEYRINECVSQGKCPDCKGKLIRGKKDKRNNYKRTWTCSECESKFTR